MEQLLVLGGAPGNGFCAAIPEAAATLPSLMTPLHFSIRRS